MKAVRLVAPTVLKVDDVDVPAPGEGEVLLKVAAAGICHSDLHIVSLPEEVLPLPLTLGHETAGHIVKLGPGVTGWSVGQGALVHLIWSCGSCAACARGDDNVCHSAGRMAQPPTPGLGPAGGMAEFMVVPARYLVALGDLDPVQAAPLADAGMTPYHVIRNSYDVLRPGSTALVIGIGGLGHVAVQLLRQLTGVRIVAVDVTEKRLEAATRHGADHVLLADETAPSAILDATNGRGAAAVFDFVGNQSSADLAVNTVAPDGIYQLVGIGGGRPVIDAAPRFGVGWPYGAAVRTSYGGTKSDLLACVALANAGRLRLDVETFALDDGLTAFDRLHTGSINGRAVLCP